MKNTESNNTESRGQVENPGKPWLWWSLLEIIFLAVISVCYFLTLLTFAVNGVTTKVKNTLKKYGPN